MCNSELEIQRNELKKVTALRSMPAIQRKQEELQKVSSFLKQKEVTSFLFNKKERVVSSLESTSDNVLIVVIFFIE